jgi:hypothetical protein
MPAQSIPPLVIITLGVAGMGALQYGVHWIFKPTKVASPPHPRAANPPRTHAGHHAAQKKAGGKTARTALTRALLCATASPRVAAAVRGRSRRHSLPAGGRGAALGHQRRLHRIGESLMDGERRPGNSVDGVPEHALSNPTILTQLVLTRRHQTGPCSSAHTRAWTSGITICRTGMPSSFGRVLVPRPPRPRGGTRRKRPSKSTPFRASESTQCDERGRQRRSIVKIDLKSATLHVSNMAGLGFRVCALNPLPALHLFSFLRANKALLLSSSVANSAETDNTASLRDCQSDCPASAKAGERVRRTSDLGPAAQQKFPPVIKGET